MLMIDGVSSYRALSRYTLPRVLRFLRSIQLHRCLIYALRGHGRSGLGAKHDGALCSIKQIMGGRSDNEVICFGVAKGAHDDQIGPLLKGGLVHNFCNAFGCSISLLQRDFQPVPCIHIGKFNCIGWCSRGLLRHAHLKDAERCTFINNRQKIV